jgi:microcystin-dependent protein
MADPFLGEIRMFAGNFAPVGWMTCDGQTLPISEYTALFSLIGTYYGGNGTTSFALPDLRGRAAAHITAGAQPGQQGGSETVTLTVAQLPTHSHTAEAATTGTVRSPAGQVWAADSGQNVAPYAAAPNGHTLAGSAIGPQGGGQPHDNMQPFLAVSFIIAVDGIYPSRP